MVIGLTDKKTKEPVNVDTDTVLLIDVMEDGSTRIVTRKDVFYVSEDLETIALIKAGIKNPGELKELKLELAELQRKISELTDERNKAIKLYREKDRELDKKLQQYKTAHSFIADPEGIIMTPADFISHLFSN
jgi:hypothetical protein